MSGDTFAFKESQERKRIHPDEYHPAGLNAVHGIIPMAFIIVAVVTVCVLVFKDDSRDRLLKASFALAFGSMGLMTGYFWWQKAKLNRRRSLGMDAAMRDYPWNPHEWLVRGSHRFKVTLFWSVLITCFLLMFNVWVFRDGMAFPSIGLIVILAFDLLPVWLWCNAGYHWLQARKFGASRVEYLRFPYSVSEPVRLRWIVPRNVREVREASFTLRCLHQRIEHIIRRGSHSSNAVNEEWWAGEWRLKTPEQWTAGECIELEWEVLPGLPVTKLTGEENYFWRLDVRLSLPGADFFAGYLIPIYE